MSETLGQLLNRLHSGMVSFDQLASWYYERGIEKDTLNSEIAALREENERLERDYQESTKTGNQWLAQCAKQGHEIDALRARLATAQAELAEAKEDIAKIGDSLTKTIEDRNTCRGKLRGLENQLIATNTELATLRKVVSMMEKGEWGYKSVASNDATFWYINNIDAKAANLDIAKMKEGMK